MSALWVDPDPIDQDSTDQGRGPAERLARAGRTLLRPVTLPEQRMARVPFVLVLIAIFGLGMAGLLLLNTTLQSQAFESQRLNTEATQLTYQQASLSRQLDQVQAPQQLAKRASALGMRPNPYPGFVREVDGKIVGYPEAVKGNEDPTQIVKTPEQLRAEAVAAQQAAEAKAAAALAKQQADAAAAAQQQADAASASAAPTASSSAGSQPGASSRSSASSRPSASATGRASSTKTSSNSTTKPSTEPTGRN